jgi:hypothetical protein
MLTLALPASGLPLTASVADVTALLASEAAVSLAEEVASLTVLLLEQPTRLLNTMAAPPTVSTKAFHPCISFLVPDDTDGLHGEVWFVAIRTDVE